MDRSTNNKQMKRKTEHKWKHKQITNELNKHKHMETQPNHKQMQTKTHGNINK